MSYGWNKEKQGRVRILQSRGLANPKPDFTKAVQTSSNPRTIMPKRNTLSFVISPTIEDGKQLKARAQRDDCKVFSQGNEHYRNIGHRLVHRNPNRIPMSWWYRKPDRFLTALTITTVLSKEKSS